MRGYAGIGLYHPKNAINVGSVLRAAGCYEARFIAVMGARYKRSCTDTQKQIRHIPLFHVDSLRDATPFDCIPVAIEIAESATSLVDYVHPERALYIFGPEDGSLPRSVIDYCAHVVRVPTAHCMNLAATVNVVLYDRLAKGLNAKMAATRRVAAEFSSC